MTAKIRLFFVFVATFMCGSVLFGMEDPRHKPSKDEFGFSADYFSFDAAGDESGEESGVASDVESGRESGEESSAVESDVESAGGSNWGSSDESTEKGSVAGDVASGSESEGEVGFAEGKRTVVVLNGPSGSGKSSVVRTFLERVGDDGWDGYTMDDISEKSAGVTRKDSEDVVQNKIIKKMCSDINDGLDSGNNAVCDVVLKSNDEINLFKKKLGKNIRLVMVFVHNPLSRLIRNLEARNAAARRSESDDEERGFNQVMDDFGTFYGISEINMKLGNFSPEDITNAMESGEGRNYLQKNDMSPNTYVDRFLKFRYPIFKIESQTFLKLNFGKYDLVIDNENIDASVSKILGGHGLDYIDVDK